MGTELNLNVWRSVLRIVVCIILMAEKTDVKICTSASSQKLHFKKKLSSIIIFLSFLLFYD